jgi:hypothetical protein
MADSGTTDKDLGYKQILREVGKARSSYVDVGYWGGKTHPGDSSATIPYIASIHEFGTKPGTTPSIPERSFVRSTADENRSKYQAMLDKGLGQILARKATVKNVLAMVGEFIIGDIRQKLTKSDPSWPELKDSTKASRQHGGTQPLFDTGALARSGGTRVIINGAKVAEKGAN